MNSEFNIVIGLVCLLLVATISIGVGIPVSTLRGESTPAPTPAPTFDPLCGILVGCQFSPTNFDAWTTLPGQLGDLPTPVAYGDLPEFPLANAPPENNGFCLDIMSDNSFEYALNIPTAQQIVDVTDLQSQEFSLTFETLVRPTSTAGADKLHAFVIFQDSELNFLNLYNCQFQEIGGNGLTFYQSFSGGYNVKTNGRIESNAFVVDSDYPVYRKSGNDSVFFLYDTTNDAWRGFIGLTYDVNDLAASFDMGTDGVNYIGEDIFPTATFVNTNAGAEVPNCPQSNNALRQLSLAGFQGIAASGYNFVNRNNPSTVEETWLKYELSSYTVPATATQATVAIQHNGGGNEVWCIDKIYFDVV